jgi:hypothetical protein
MPDPLSIGTWRNVFTKHSSKFGIALVVIFSIPLIGYGVNQFTGRVNPSQMAPELDQAILKVNGESIPRRDLEMMMQRMRSAPSEQSLIMQGMIMEGLIRQAVIRQEAKSQNVRPDDADIDKAILEIRERQLGKEATDAKWNEFLAAQNMTPSELREEVAKGLLEPALRKQFEAKEQVTETDAKNSNSQVKLALVVVPVAGSKTPVRKGIKPLPDAEAKTKAEALLKQAQSGADMKALAKGNSADFSADRGGETTYLSEYQAFSIMEDDPYGATGYGKAFDEAVQKTQAGQFTPVVKTTGASEGYAFAKVMERRNQAPKDFDVKKKIEEIKQMRAQSKFQKYLNDKIKTAKIEFVDPEKKTFYDYYKLKSGQGGMMGMMGMQQPQTVNKAEKEKKEAEVIQGLEAVLKKTPGDAAASLALASLLKTRRFTAPDTKAREAIDTRLISLYEAALGQTENPELRFELAEYYRNLKQNDKAAAQYIQIATLQNVSPPYDVPSAQKAVMTYEKVQNGLRALNKVEEAKKFDTQKNEAMQKMIEYQAKQAEEQRKQQEAMKKQAPPAEGTAPPPLKPNTEPPKNQAPNPAAPRTEAPKTPGR